LYLINAIYTTKTGCYFHLVFLLILKQYKHLLSQNVIPGNHGKTFGTNAMEENDLKQLKNSLLELEGIVDII
jgi:hypothetical protein